MIKEVVCLYLTLVAATPYTAKDAWDVLVFSRFNMNLPEKQCISLKESTFSVTTQEELFLACQNDDRFTQCEYTSLKDIIDVAEARYNTAVKAYYEKRRQCDQAQLMLEKCRSDYHDALPWYARYFSVIQGFYPSTCEKKDYGIDPMACFTAMRPRPPGRTHAQLCTRLLRSRHNI